MIKRITTILAICLISAIIYGQFFADIPPHPKKRETVESIQKQYEEVVWERVASDFKKEGFQTFPKKIMILAFKEEQTLEVYAKRDTTWHLVKSYPFTGFSGKLGPKLKEGDYQIPEGIYKIGYLNPNSSYHLSAKINYPNSFDKEKAKEMGRSKLGGDIFIHGRSVTIGCIPLGDRAIEELFIMLIHGKKAGVKVVISPRDFRKNKVFPKIEKVDWSKELYTNIKKELELYPH